MTVHVAPTTGCNLGCSYCYENPDRERKQEWVDRQYDMDQIMDTLEEWRERYPNETPGLHGGEPLLVRTEDLRQIFSYINEHWDGNIHIQTNGTLLNEEHIELFNEFNVAVGISVDGPVELNRLRKAVAEKDEDATRATDNASRRTLDAIERCANANVSVNIIIVLNESNAGTDERLEKLLDWLDEMNEKGVNGHFNPAIPYEEISEDEDVALSRGRLKDVYLRIWEWMKEEPYRQFGPMQHYVDNLLGAKLTNCVNNKCDVANAGAAKIIKGNGESSGCGKTWSQYGDGGDFLQGPSNDTEYNDSEERYEVLQQTPGWVTEGEPDMGGCKGCEYWNVCYDDETEVLTADGWKSFANVTMNTTIATLNQDTHAIEYHNPIAIQTPNYDGDLIHWSGDTYDLRVTPDHNVFARSSPGQAFENHRAAEIEENSAISFKRGGSWNGESMETFTPKPAVLADDAIVATPKPRHRTFDAGNWFKFLGWYLAEGSSQRKPNGNHRVTICQHSDGYRSEIESLLERMGFSVYMDEKNIQFDSKQIVDHVKQFGTSEEKYVPNYVKDASTELIRTFLISYAKGDGTLRDDGTPRIIYTSSERMADDLQELGMKADWPSTKGVDERVEKDHFTINSPVYYTTFAPSKSEVEVWTDSERESYDGTVYDLTVPNHTMYVRRNGKALWSGNCNGGCPGAGQNDNYRNRTHFCQAKHALYSKIEDDLRTLLPNIRLITDLPWDADINHLSTSWQLDIKPFAAMRPGVDGRSSATMGYSQPFGSVEDTVPDEAIPEQTFEESLQDAKEEYPEEVLTVDREESTWHADSALVEENEE